MDFKQKSITKNNSTKARFFQSGGTVGGETFNSTVSYVPTTPNIINSNFYKYQLPEEQLGALPDDKDMLKNMDGLTGEQEEAYKEYVGLKNNFLNNQRKYGKAWEGTTESKDILNKLNMFAAKAVKLKRNLEERQRGDANVKANEIGTTIPVSKDGNFFVFNNVNKKLVEIPYEQVKVYKTANNPNFKLVESHNELADLTNKYFNTTPNEDGKEDIMHYAITSSNISPEKANNKTNKEFNEVRGNNETWPQSKHYITAAESEDKSMQVIGIGSHSFENKTNADALWAKLGMDFLRDRDKETSKQYLKRINDAKAKIETNNKNDKVLSFIGTEEEKIKNNNQYTQKEKTKKLNELEQYKEGRVQQLFYANQLDMSNYWKELPPEYKNALKILSAENLNFEQDDIAVKAGIADNLLNKIGINLQRSTKSTNTFSNIGKDILGTGIEVKGSKSVDDLNTIIQLVKSHSIDGSNASIVAPYKVKLGDVDLETPYAARLRGTGQADNFDQSKNTFKERFTDSSYLGRILDPQDKEEHRDEVGNDLPKEVVESGYVDNTKDYTIYQDNYINDGEKIIPAREYFIKHQGGAAWEALKKAIKNKNEAAITIAKNNYKDTYTNFLQQLKKDIDEGKNKELQLGNSTTIVIPVVNYINEADLVELEADGVKVERLKPKDPIIRTLNKTRLDTGITTELDNTDKTLIPVRMFVSKRTHPNGYLAAMGSSDKTEQNVSEADKINFYNGNTIGKDGLIYKTVMPSRQQGGVIFPDSKVEKPKFVFKPLTLQDID